MKFSKEIGPLCPGTGVQWATGWDATNILKFCVFCYIWSFLFNNTNK